jgi:hypothetical protein
MNRNYMRIGALALFLYLSVSPTANAASRKDRDLSIDPGERVVRIVKKIKNIFRGIGSQDDQQIPPTPRP